MFGCILCCKTKQRVETYYKWHTFRVTQAIVKHGHMWFSLPVIYDHTLYVVYTYYIGCQNLTDNHCYWMFLFDTWFWLHASEWWLWPTGEGYNKHTSASLLPFAIMASNLQQDKIWSPPLHWHWPIRENSHWRRLPASFASLFSVSFSSTSCHLWVFWCELFWVSFFRS